MASSLHAGHVAIGEAASSSTSFSFLSTSFSLSPSPLHTTFHGNPRLRSSLNCFPSKLHTPCFAYSLNAPLRSSLHPPPFSTLTERSAHQLSSHRPHSRFLLRAIESEDRPASENQDLPIEKIPAWMESPQSNQAFDSESSPIQKWLYPSKEELPDDVEMTIWDHLEELRERILVSVGIVGLLIAGCFFYSKDLVTILEAPVYSQGVRFLQLSPGEFFFTTLKVSGYSGLLLGSPVILYEIIAFVVPGLTLSERRFLSPIVFGSSILFYTGLFFSYKVLTPAALTFFINYAEGVVESLWSIDQYFEFVFVLMLSTGLAFQVPVIQLLLGQTGLVSGKQMLSIWRYVVVGAVIAAAVLTPSTDPLTQLLLAGPLIALYMGGAYAVILTESTRHQPEQ